MHRHSLFLPPILLFILSLGSPPQASDYAVANTYVRSGDLQQAYRTFRVLAEVGYPVYLNKMGDMHSKGEGVPASDLMAHVWYSLSAAQGDALGRQKKAQLEARLSADQVSESRSIAGRYARLYLEPYIAEWSLD